MATKKQQKTSTLAALLKGKSAADFNETQLMRKANVRWRRGELFEAFVLMDAAAARAKERKQTISERAYLNRAAVLLFRSGREPNEARKRLRAVVAHYRKHRRDIEDRHFVDWALTSLLEDVAQRSQSAKAFEKAYRAAVVEGSAILGKRDGPFPRIHLERLAHVAVDVGAHGIAHDLIAQRRARKPLPRKVRMRLDALERRMPSP